MNLMEEPVVLIIHPSLPEPWQAVLADIVVVAGDCPVRGWSGELFNRYPGLTLVLVAYPSGPSGAVTARLRDGTTLTLRLGGVQAVSSGQAIVVAGFVRRHWAAVVDLLVA